MPPVLIALLIALVHPSFSILPGIVQPEPFILAAWTLAALMTVQTLREGPDPRRLLGAGVLFGLGLCLHPQGLSFLLVALALCLLPWARELFRRPAILLVPLLGIASVTLPAAVWTPVTNEVFQGGDVIIAQVATTGEDRRYFRLKK